MFKLRRGLKGGVGGGFRIGLGSLLVNDELSISKTVDEGLGTGTVIEGAFKGVFGAGWACILKVGVSQGEPCEVGSRLEFNGLTGIGDGGVKGGGLVGLDGLGEMGLASGDEGAEMDVGRGGGQCLDDGGAMMHSAVEVRGLKRLGGEEKRLLEAGFRRGGGGVGAGGGGFGVGCCGYGCGRVVGVECGGGRGGLGRDGVVETLCMMNLYIFGGRLRGGRLRGGGNLSGWLCENGLGDETKGCVVGTVGEGLMQNTGGGLHVGGGVVGGEQGEPDGGQLRGDTYGVCGVAKSVC